MNRKYLSRLALPIVGMTLLGPARAADPAPGPPLGATTIVSVPGQVVKVHGSIASGARVDLAFAAKSSVACFPSIRNVHFNGNQVFYATTLPAASTMKIRVIPAKPGLDLNLYAFSAATTSKALPPNVSSVVSCEASHGGRKSLSQPFNPGEVEQVELRAVPHPYGVVIAVAGAQGITDGDFDLEVELSPAPTAQPTGKISSATAIEVRPNDTASVSGAIQSGVRIPLSWAANSSVACFPATRFNHFDGNHVVYSFDLPRNTTAKVELVPRDPKVDLSLYAYSVGPSFPALPPSVPSVVSCEASYGTKSIASPFNPGGTEKVELVAGANPYKVFVGVAGAQSAKAGDFTLKVTLSAR